ncbi:hypothetical protein [Ezakiella coagulans]|uniref:hypothetical protein n=1 Tax=Ezakiella coagulans TaxID=46507 RepID=UPI00288A7D27|nr:hypothetical protein [Ezakiella coagulans]
MSYIIAIVLIILKIVDSIYETNNKKNVEKNIPKKDNTEKIKTRIDNIKDEETKKRLIKLLKNAEKEFAEDSNKNMTLDKKSDDKINKTNIKTKESKTNKAKIYKESAIVDSRSLENAIPHTDDSVYSHMIKNECGIEHGLGKSIYEKDEEAQSRFLEDYNEADLKKYIAMKEILDEPVSMK